MLFWKALTETVFNDEIVGQVPVSEAFLDGMAARVTARVRELPLPEPQYVSGILWAFSRIRAGQPLSAIQVIASLKYGESPKPWRTLK